MIYISVHIYTHLRLYYCFFLLRIQLFSFPLSFSCWLALFTWLTKSFRCVTVNQVRRYSRYLRCGSRLFSRLLVIATQYILFSLHKLKFTKRTAYSIMYIYAVAIYTLNIFCCVILCVLFLLLLLLPFLLIIRCCSRRRRCRLF